MKKEHSKIFTAITCFLDKKEHEVDNALYCGHTLWKGGRQELDNTMTSVTYQTDTNPCTAFVVIFDTDFDNNAVCQKTTWGDETKQIYDTIYQEEYCGIRYAFSDGFVVYTEEHGHLLIEMQHHNGIDFIVVSKEEVC